MSCHALTFFRRNIMGNFSEIKTRNDFADFLRIPRNKLTHILYVKNLIVIIKLLRSPRRMEIKEKFAPHLVT